MEDWLHWGDIIYAEWEHLDKYDILYIKLYNKWEKQEKNK